ncbi:hypothetical protein CRG98_027555 [Punica granatum]|uniref:Uncharacterized protein n=1 Tax=Punica granatum TaxID=22663 RepID=A0A2I0J7C5_PUNGR|nr:hypothetical protein CRG98_027555 [Punica granatum]
MNSIMELPTMPQRLVLDSWTLGDLRPTLSSPLRGSFSPLQGSSKTFERSRISTDPNDGQISHFLTIFGCGKARSSLATPKLFGKGRSEKVMVVEAVAIHMALEVALEMVATMVVVETVEEETIVMEEG